MDVPVIIPRIIWYYLGILHSSRSAKQPKQGPRVLADEVGKRSRTNDKRACETGGAEISSRLRWRIVVESPSVVNHLVNEWLDNDETCPADWALGCIRHPSLVRNPHNEKSWLATLAEIGVSKFAERARRKRERTWVSAVQIAWKPWK